MATNPFSSQKPGGLLWAGITSGLPHCGIQRSQPLPPQHRKGWQVLSKSQQLHKNENLPTTKHSARHTARTQSIFIPSMKGCMNEIPHLCIPEDNPVLDIFRIHSTELWKRTKKKKKKKKQTTQMKPGAGIGSVI